MTIPRFRDNDAALIVIGVTKMAAHSSWLDYQRSTRHKLEELYSLIGDPKCPGHGRGNSGRRTDTDTYLLELMPCSR